MADLFQKLRIPLFLCLIVFGICGVCAKDTALNSTETEALLNELEKRLSRITTLRASFDQTKCLALFDDTLLAKGSIHFSNPGNIRFEISDPFRSVLVVSGKRVAKYEHDKGKWKKLVLKNTDALALVMKQIGAWMTGDFRSQSRVFEIGALKRDGNTYLVLKSKPKRFAKLIERIEIELAPDRSRFLSITIREPGGDYTVLSFTGDVRGHAFSEGVFDVDKSQPVEIGEKKP